MPFKTMWTNVLRFMFLCVYASSVSACVGIIHSKAFEVSSITRDVILLPSHVLHLVFTSYILLEEVW